MHDTVRQHLRALKAMEYEPSGPFTMSALELKLDVNTMFEWQKNSQEESGVPHFNTLLEFINVRTQASETSISGHKVPSRNDAHPTRKPPTSSKPMASFAASATGPANGCVLCKTDKHPLYACPRFRSLSHDKMLLTLKVNNLCMNCLRPGHFIKQYKSLHRYRKC